MFEIAGSNAEILENTRQFCKTWNYEGLRCNKETWTNQKATSGKPKARHLAPLQGLTFWKVEVGVRTPPWPKVSSSL